MLQPTIWNNQSKNLARHLELSKRWRTFSPKKRGGKLTIKKAAHMKHKAARARSRLGELASGTFNVRTAAVNGVNGVGYIDRLLNSMLLGLVMFLNCREPNGTGNSKASHLNTVSISAVIAAGSKVRKSNMRWTGWR